MAQWVDRRERTKFIKDIFKNRRGVGINCWFKLLLKDPANQISRRHCVVSLGKNINPSLVLVQPRNTRPFITERLLMGRKESNQTKQKNNQISQLNKQSAVAQLVDRGERTKFIKDIFKSRRGVGIIS